MTAASSASLVLNGFTTMDRDAAWSVAEELILAGYMTEAACVLEGLVAAYAVAPSRSADPSDEISTRVRVADLLLTKCSQHNVPLDAVKLLLEPAITGAHGADPRVSAALRRNCHRLHGIVMRRKQKFTAAVAAFNTALQYTDPNDRSTQDALALEVARVHFSRCVDSSFLDESAVDALHRATGAVCTAMSAGHIAAPTESTLTMVVLHALTLVAKHEWQRAVALLTTAEALMPDAAANADVGFMILLVRLAAGLPTASANNTTVGNGRLSIGAAATAVTTAADGGPQRKAHRTETHEEAAAVEGGRSTAQGADAFPTARDALRPLCTLLLQCGAGGRQQDITEAYSAFSTCADGAIRRINATSAGQMTAAAHTELRLLVGAKLAAFYELAITDLTTMNLAGAAMKLETLTQYITMYVRHTAHFRGCFHAAAACLALLLGQPEPALRHAGVLAELAAESPTSHEAVLSALVTAVAHYGAGHAKEFAECVNVYQLGSDPAAAVARQTPRYAALWALLSARHLLNQGDYPRAATVLKASAANVRDAFGVQAPLLGASLALLGEAHAESGNRVASEGSMTMAMQVATATADGFAMAQCLTWALTRMPPPLSQREIDQRTHLAASTAAKLDVLAKATDAALKCDATKAVLGFTPTESTAYRDWLRKAQQGLQRRGSARAVMAQR